MHLLAHLLIIFEGQSSHLTTHLLNECPSATLFSTSTYSHNSGKTTSVSSCTLHRRCDLTTHCQNGGKPRLRMHHRRSHHHRPIKEHVTRICGQETQESMPRELDAPHMKFR